MRAYRRVGVAAALLCAAASGQAPAWKPAGGNLLTEWAARVDPARPLAEYPRPQMVRNQWRNLNGLWEYAVTDFGAARPGEFEGRILVPFPIESALSGVKRPLTAKQNLWYRRSFDYAAPARDQRVLLHFGAVDWEAAVFLNGKDLGTHKGGYDGFSFDITDTLAANNELVVRVWDPTGSNASPKGKQRVEAVAKPSGIFYTPSSGIWQTVWLESVPAAGIAGLKIVPDVDAGLVRVTVEGRGATSDDLTVEAVAMDGARQAARAAGGFGRALEIRIPKAKLWSPTSPFLYGLRVTARKGAQVVDSVESYFGMRKIALGKDAKGVTRLMLNDRFVFQAGPLDQGFWPDGIYTAPTDEALRYDIEITKKLGFNMARKHVKVEPDRWYYWCDKLGLLVWQDMPGSGTGRGANRNQDGVRVSDEVAAQFETELKAMVEQHWNHPSIVMWVVFNESWGQYETPRVTKWVKQLDPSRLVDNASGWHDCGAGDVIDMHKYPGPGSPSPEENRAAVLGEFGGLGLGVAEHTWVKEFWGYRSLPGRQSLHTKYIDLWREVWKLRESAGLSAAVYTQITDVETECNGLVTYDRKVVKVDLPEASEAVARGKFPPAPVYRTVVPAAKDQASLWRYTIDKPPENWYQQGFDASSWQEGAAGFGTNPPNAVSRTPWRTLDIWVRREFTLPAGPLKGLMLNLYHDEDAEVYLNGVLAVKVARFNTDWEPTEIAPEALAALRPGRNIMAIHCHQTTGAQYIDAGFVQLQGGK